MLRASWPSLLPRPETLLRWHRELVRRRWSAYRLRPRRQSANRGALCETIVRLARENPHWGYRRIQGELLKLGVSYSHLTVLRILRRHRLGPAPRGGQGSDHSFVRQHADQMLACDLFLVDTVWLTQFYVFFFIEIGSRCVHLAGCTYNPTAEWVVQQARNLAWQLQDGTLSAKFLVRDRDSKFTTAFDEVFRTEGVEIVRLPCRAPRANSIAVRFVGTGRRECLDHMLIFGRQHLERMLTDFIEHYHRARPHQGLEQRLPRPQAEVRPLSGQRAGARRSPRRPHPRVPMDRLTR